jgi:hypothetical protein
VTLAYRSKRRDAPHASDATGLYRVRDNEVRSRTALVRRLRCYVGRLRKARLRVVDQNYAPKAVIPTLAAGRVVAEYATQRPAS